ncbi:pitrilysin family protein [Marivirga atlantica]|jgi:predicted Zn-dependent peptidase|uniref:Insulinase family protein n=1 Tax=Marivirga atlantica TaxID=1548457 RepID=A0A937DJ32_9BACT|nr:pitrilysin family protein [Marivirga atlantica]MBL0764796.1 insulinase family protein [Marivirga atlantica]
MKSFQVRTLNNGIRVVHQPVNNSKIVHCGFTLDVGSRDEKPHQVGIAHFWEHMAFKGTEKRKAYHILNRLDSVGGELNAYTTKEKIFFHASVLEQHVERAIDLLTDITFNSNFPEKQIQKERQVILEEMAMYADSPEDAIQDEFDEVIFSDHPLGNNILGTQKSLKSFTREDFINFLDENIDTERIVFSVVGDIKERKLNRLIDKYLYNIPHKTRQRDRLLFDQYKPKTKNVKKEISQAQCAIGTTAYPIHHPKRLPFFMLSNILGGPGMNTRLNMVLREKHGFVYAIDAGYHPFIDTALFSIFFGTDPGQLNRSINLVKKELQKLQKTPLGSLQLHVAKEQLMGQLAMAEENNMSFMLMLGRSLLDKDNIESIDEIFTQIKKISANELMDIANEVWAEENLSILTYSAK